MGRLFHIVQRGGDWAGPQAVQATLAFDGWTVTFGTAKRGLRPLFAVPNVTVHPDVPETGTAVFWYTGFWRRFLVSVSWTQ